MSQISTLFQSLVSVAVVSMIVLGVGALITRTFRQPIERVRCIQWTLAALMVALFVRHASVLPPLSLKIFPAESVAAPTRDSFIHSSPIVQVRPIHNTMAEAPLVATTKTAEVSAATTTAIPAVKDTMPRLSWGDGWIAFQLVSLLVAAAGALYCVVQLAVGHWQLCKLLAHSEPASESLLSKWPRTSEARSYRIRVFVSRMATVPMTFGIRKPVIILPKTLAESLDSQTLTYCLSHEFAHIRSRDNLTWCVVQWLQPVLWFQPMFWLLRRELRIAQDQLADNCATERDDDRTEFATLLTGMARERMQFSGGLALSMADRRSGLYRRIELLLSDQFRVARVARRRVLLGTITCFAIVTVSLGVMRLEQATASPVDEVKVSAKEGANEGDKKEDAKNADAMKNEDAAEPPVGIQVMESLPIRVLDPEGQPVPGAVVTPWALRSSQGHGPWRDDDPRAGVEPKAAITNENGRATIAYPYFRDLQEGTRTTEVSIFVDHRDFAFSDAIFIDVPHEEELPYELKLDYGVPVELRPTILGQSADTDNLFAFWSDGRSWQPSDAMERTAESTLRLPPLRPGPLSVLVAKLDGDRVTHFSEILQVEVSPKDNSVVDVPLKPAQRIEGVLSDDVPRPVANGRIKFETLTSSREDYGRVTWFSWVPIRSDGTFTIEAWPTGEKIQLIALCDGFIAKSGQAPAESANPGDPTNDPRCRPQVFSPSDKQPITVQMEPLVECVVTAVNQDDKPVAGITIESWPNVSWWNAGGGIYCEYLVRCERRLRVRDYLASIDNDFPAPFHATTDSKGNATLQLPHGRERLAITSDLYELAIRRGFRDVSVELVPGQRTEVTLRLQSRGTERLGE